MRKTINFLILALTILIMNLLTGFITEYFFNYRGVTNPYKFTAIGMIVLIAVLYPLFMFMEGKVKDTTRHVLKKGKNILGIFIVFIILISILYCVYANLWFNINIPKVIFSKM